MSFWPSAHRWPGCWSWLWSSRGQESPSFSLTCWTTERWRVTRVIVDYYFKRFCFAYFSRHFVHHSTMIIIPSECDYNVLVMLLYLMTLSFNSPVLIYPHIYTFIFHQNIFQQTFQTFLKQTSKVDILSWRSSISATSICQVRGNAPSCFWKITSTWCHFDEQRWVFKGFKCKTQERGFLI